MHSDPDGSWQFFSKTRKTLPGNPHEHIVKAGEAPRPPLPYESLPWRCLPEVHRRSRCPVFIKFLDGPSFLKRYCHDQGPLFFQKA